MTEDKLISLLGFEQDLRGVEILRCVKVEPDAEFVVANLIYKDSIMMVPFVHFANEDWIFTPWDWQQEGLPVSPDRITDIAWRVDDSDVEGVNFMGLPRLAPWTDYPARICRRSVGARIREARQRAGLSVDRLAELTGIQQSHLSRIEGGRANATIDTYSRIFAALGIEFEVVRSKPLMSQRRKLFRFQRELLHESLETTTEVRDLADMARVIDERLNIFGKEHDLTNIRISPREIIDNRLPEEWGCRVYNVLADSDGGKWVVGQCNFFESDN